jgi:predicted Zn-dependent protease with MMP-like domain
MTLASQTPPTLADIEMRARAALERLPEPFAAHLGDVVLIVEDFAEDAVLDEMGIESAYDLTGLYTGHPIGQPRETGDPPATIHLYRRPILDEWCENGEALDHLVAHVVVHEVGHHFGLSDADMHALEDAVS